MIIFRNRGLIDIAAAITLGVSVKEEGAIGHFGTGVKFGVATILRCGGSVSIWRGKTEHRFSTKRETIRDKEFDLVTLDGQALGFTTQLGRDWQPWMAFRELACNALDEGGSYYSNFEVGEIAADETVIVVDCEEITDAYAKRGEILLQSKPIYANEHIEIRPGPATHIFYRGVRVGQLPRPTRHHYNILTKIDLTEDRTILWDFQVLSAIRRGLSECDREDLIEPAITCGDEYIEHHITFLQSEEPSEAFMKTATRVRGTPEHVRHANPSVMKIVRALKLAELGPAQSVALNSIEQQRFERAKSFLKAAGYDLDEYPVVIVESLGEGMYGLASEGKVFITKAAFQKGTKEVASTLLEEFVHLKTGFGDMTRSLQTWLFDELLSQAERATGTAL